MAHRSLERVSEWSNSAVHALPMLMFHLIVFLVASGFVLSVNLGLDTMSNAQLRRPGGYPIVPDYVELAFAADIDITPGRGFPLDQAARENVLALDLHDVTMIGVADSTRASHSVYSALKFDDWIMDSANSGPSKARIYDVQAQLEAGMTAFDLHVHDFYDGYHLLDASLPFDSAVDAYITLESVLYVIGRYASVHADIPPIVIRISFDSDPYRKSVCANPETMKVLHEILTDMFHRPAVLVRPTDIMPVTDNYLGIRSYIELNGFGAIESLTGKVIVFISQPLQDYDDESCARSYMTQFPDPTEATLFFMADTVTTDPSIAGIFLGYRDETITAGEETALAAGKLPLFGYISKSALENTKTDSVVLTGIYFTDFFEPDVCSKTAEPNGCVSGKFT